VKYNKNRPHNSFKQLWMANAIFTAFFVFQFPIGQWSQAQCPATSASSPKLPFCYTCQGPLPTCHVAILLSFTQTRRNPTTLQNGCRGVEELPCGFSSYHRKSCHQEALRGFDGSTSSLCSLHQQVRRGFRVSISQIEPLSLSTSFRH
jgi:hypothetical protein